MSYETRPKYPTRALAIVLLLGGFAGLAWSASAQPRARDAERFERLDTNGDGVVSREEFEAGTDPFARLDRDGDGVLSPADRGRRGRHRAAMRRMHERREHGPRLGDTDGDGTLTAEEWQAFVDALDADGDGAIPRADLDAVWQERPGLPQRLAERGLPEAIARRLDTNGDGVFETAELEASFTARDTDGNGVLDRADRPARMFGGDRHRGAMIARAADRGGDGDGTVSADEWRAFVNRADGDGDGSVTHTELREAVRPTIDRPERAITVEELEARFTELDADGDGNITADEMRQSRGGGPRHRDRGRRFGDR